MTTWYTGCPVCSGSCASLITGQYHTRVGVPVVLMPSINNSLNLNETTSGQQMKQAGHATAAVGKWHLGQRVMYLRGNRGFDAYLGIPYSVDMGDAAATNCTAEEPPSKRILGAMGAYSTDAEHAAQFRSAGPAVGCSGFGPGYGCAPNFLPLVQMSPGKSSGKSNYTVLERPVDLSKLSETYDAFVSGPGGFLERNARSKTPFFLYWPFSHVLATSSLQPQPQFAGCAFHNASRRGFFEDALAEVD